MIAELLNLRVIGLCNLCVSWWYSELRILNYPWRILSITLVLSCFLGMYEYVTLHFRMTFLKISSFLSFFLLASSLVLILLMSFIFTRWASPFQFSCRFTGLRLQWLAFASKQLIASCLKHSLVIFLIASFNQLRNSFSVILCGLFLIGTTFSKEDLVVWCTHTSSLETHIHRFPTGKIVL